MLVSNSALHILLLVCYKSTKLGTDTGTHYDLENLLKQTDLNGKPNCFKQRDLQKTNLTLE